MKINITVTDSADNSAAELAISKFGPVTGGKLEMVKFGFGKVGFVVPRIDVLNALLAIGGDQSFEKMGRSK